MSFTVHGTLSLSATQVTDIELQTDPRSSITMNAVTVNTVSAPLTLVFACPTTILNSRLNDVQLQVASMGELTVTGPRSGAQRSVWW